MGSLEYGLDNCSTSGGLGFFDLQPSDLCYIDAETVRVLELLENNIDRSNKRHSLLGFLNINTCTTTGSRLLKQSISQPLNNIATIEHRLNCVEFLVNRVDSLSHLSNSIRQYGQNIDLDSVMPCIIQLLKSKSDTLMLAEKRIDALVNIEVIVSGLDTVISALGSVNQQNLNIYKTALEDPGYQEILSIIHRNIEPETKMKGGKRSRIFKLRHGIDPVFDMARSTYNVAIGDLEQLVVELHKADGLNWKLTHNQTRGYFLSLSTDKLGKNVELPTRYIQVNRSRYLITCTTAELMKSNNRANVSYENSMMLANEILRDALARIAEHMLLIQKLVDIVGMLDLICSFGKLVINNHGRYVRPKFNSTETIISKARHPVLESVLATNNLVTTPNDIVLSAGRKNLMLITGPNMGGKSIYLKQVALVQIMAQMGCFVPAESAYIRLVNRIVARCGASDDHSSTCSTFMREMKGIASALQDVEHSPRNVLYIIDEVGRGTTVDDGASYSFAIAEELALRKTCFTVFATHFDEVFALTSLYENVIAHHFQYEKSEKEGEKSKLKITHSLIPGVVEQSHYGIDLAESLGFPDEIIQLARKGIAVETTA